jgi:flagellar protein FlaI
VGAIKEMWQRIRYKQLKTLPPYDPNTHEPLAEFKVPDVYTEVERSWVDEPYALRTRF